MKKIISLLVLVIILFFWNSVFAEENSFSWSNIIKIQDNYWKILHQYYLENSSDGNINLIFDWNKQILKEKPIFFFLENWDYFIYYKDDNTSNKINHNWKITSYSVDKKSSKIFDGEKNLFSKNHFIRTSQKNDKNVVLKKNYFVNDNWEIIPTIEVSIGNQETFTGEIVYWLSKTKIRDDFMYSSYYSFWKWPASYVFYKSEIIKFYGKIETVTDWENYLIFWNDENENTIVYLNLNLIYKWNKDWAMKLFNEKYWNYREINRRYVENVTLDEYKKFVKSYLKYLDDMFLLINENIFSQTQEIKQTTQNNTTSQSNITTKERPKYLKQKILSASKLKKAKQDKYITQIDKLVEKTNNEKLEKILEKILKVKKKNDVINYLEAVIYLKINK